MGSRCGLLIGSAAFDDARISNLVGPEGDVSSLAEVLRDPSVGGFEIKLSSMRRVSRWSGPCRPSSGIGTSMISCCSFIQATD